MSPGSINLSPLERFLSTSDPASAPDQPGLDLENICALRNRSIRKFVRALESIAARYEGDGDEESDDVIDLDQLQVIEDRGYILKRLSHNSQPSPGSLKGKNRADPRLEIFELLDPSSQDADDQDDDPEEWVGQHDEDDDCHLDEDQSGSTDEEDYNSDNSDSSSVNSIPSSSSSSSSSQKIRRKEESNGKRKKPDLLPPPTSDSSTSQSAPDSLTDQSTPRISYLEVDPQNTVTNALFERLKKRVQERSSDITRHKLYKASISRDLYRPDDESCGFSSPSSSLITSTSLSSVLTTTEPMISPYLQRLLHPCATGSSRPMQDNRPRALLSVPVTPSTLRQKSFRPTSATGGALHTSPQTCSVLRKRPRPSSPIFSSPITISSSIRPALLFPSTINTAHKAKKLKPHSPSHSLPITNYRRNHHQKHQPDPQEQDEDGDDQNEHDQDEDGQDEDDQDEDDQDEDDEKERRARESSEDPMLLPASSKKSKMKTKSMDRSSTSHT